MISGYRLPFLRHPDAIVIANHKSAKVNSEFVQEAIDELLGAGCIVECTTCSRHVVVNADGKKRLVVDFRYVNQFLQIQKFK